MAAARGARRAGDAAGGGRLVIPRRSAGVAGNDQNFTGTSGDSPFWIS
jgi:hypothetical protein